MTTTCPFCQRIAGGQFTKTKLGTVVRFEPLKPVTPGHMLFVPRKHVTDDSVEPVVAGEAFTAAADYAKGRGVPHNLIASAGADATQTVLHLHVHYVPRVKGDGLPLPWDPHPVRKEPSVQTLCMRAVTNIETQEEAEQIGPALIAEMKAKFPGVLLYVDEIREPNEHECEEYAAGIQKT